MSAGALGAKFWCTAAAAVIAWIALLYVVMAGSRGSHRASHVSRRYPRWRPRYRVPPSFELSSPPPRAESRPFDLHSVDQQLHAVIGGAFEKRRLLSAGEYRVFKVVEDCVASLRRGHRVFAQTNLGEVLSSPDEAAFRSINSKRVDILVVDQGGWPVLAIEFQGGAHYQGTAAIRDAVKKEALGKAGVAYVEVFSSDTPDEIRLLVRERLGSFPNSLTAQRVG
jgi:Protein of unknown function (DUF2726)